MQLYKLGEGIYEYYIKNVRGNKGLTEKQVQKKLTRNVFLSNQFPKELNTMICFYGNLKMFIKDNVIIYIDNPNFKNRPHFPGINMRKYRELNKELGINY